MVWEPQKGGRENRLMSPEEIEEMRGQRYNATVTWQREANPDLRVLRVTADFRLPQHRPGQYSTLGLGNWEPRAPGCQPEKPVDAPKVNLIRRAYSISSSILNERGEFLDHEDVNWLEFYIVLVRNSDRPDPPALTPRLFLLQEGDRLYLGEKITGHYTTATVQPEDTVVFLATGTGEAPHNYMVWDLLRRGHRGKILSVCCVRYSQDLAYLDIHKLLMSRFPNYQYIWLTTREAGAARKVYIQELLTSGQLEERLGTSLDPAHTHVYLCGNPNMIGVPQVNRETGQKTFPNPTGVIEILEKRGFQTDQPQRKIQGNIHFEEYW
jgi:ferredoxin--NADP+ reductase